MEEHKTEEHKTEEHTTEEHTTEESTTEESTKRKRLCYLVPLAIAFVGYLGAAFYYANHFYIHTNINGIPHSNETASMVDQEMQQIGEEYSVLVLGRNGESAVISAENIGLSYHYRLSADDILDQQNALLWPVSLWQYNSYTIDYEVSYDEELLKNTLAQIPFLQKENMTAPENAHIGAYHQESRSYEIVPEKEGTLVDQDKMYEAVVSAIENRQQILRLEDCDCYVKPEIAADSEELLEELAYYNEYMQALVTYQFGAETETVDSTVYADWIEKYGSTVRVDEAAVKEYLTELADQYDTYNERMNFTTVDGYVLNLPRGDFGWKMDVEAEAELLIADIKDGNIDTREPVYSCEGVTREDEIGDFYIEVNMTDQRVYVVDQGVVIEESDCVTGNMENGCTTPPGIFGLTYKQRNATLRGRDYVSYVKYWMPFNGNIGFHDASWRNLFGGEIYLTSGSHGCVNLPTAFAQKLYDYVYKDCPIICYYLTDDVIVERPKGDMADSTTGTEGTSEISESDQNAL